MKYDKIIDKYLGEDVRSSGEFSYDEVIDLMRISRRMNGWLLIILFAIVYTIGLIGGMKGVCGIQ